MHGSSGLGHLTLVSAGLAVAGRRRGAQRARPVGSDRDPRRGPVRGDPCARGAVVAGDADPGCGALDEARERPLAAAGDRLRGRGEVEPAVALQGELEQSLLVLGDDGELAAGAGVGGAGQRQGHRAVRVRPGVDADAAGRRRPGGVAQRARGEHGGGARGRGAQQRPGGGEEAGGPHAPPPRTIVIPAGSRSGSPVPIRSPVEPPQPVDLSGDLGRGRAWPEQRLGDAPQALAGRDPMEPLAAQRPRRRATPPARHPTARPARPPGLRAADVRLRGRLVRRRRGRLGGRRRSGRLGGRRRERAARRPAAERGGSAAGSGAGGSAAGSGAGGSAAGGGAGGSTAGGSAPVRPAAARRPPAAPPRALRPAAAPKAAARGRSRSRARAAGAAAKGSPAPGGPPRTVLPAGSSRSRPLRRPAQAGAGSPDPSAGRPRPRTGATSVASSAIVSVRCRETAICPLPGRQRIS